MQERGVVLTEVDMITGVQKEIPAVAIVVDFTG